MRRVLSGACRPMLEALATKRALFAFDFDGTLAPIVDDREVATMRAETRQLFARLTTLATCAVISGRARADLVPRLVGMPLAFVVGNHGAEWGDGADEAGARREMAAARAVVEPIAARFSGVSIEDKGLSLTVHLRGRDAREAERAVLAAFGGARARLMLGKRVVNVLPSGASDKGSALVEMIRRAKCDAAMFVGDDVTDEDAFRDPGVAPFVSVRVGESATSRAAWFLRDQGEIDELLRLLIALRGGPSAS